MVPIQLGGFHDPKAWDTHTYTYTYTYIYIYITVYSDFPSYHTGKCSQSHCQLCCDGPVGRSSYMLLLSTRLSRCQMIGALRNEFAAKRNSKVSPQMLRRACVHWTWSLCTNRNPEVADANPCVSTLKSNFAQVAKLWNCMVFWVHQALLPSLSSKPTPRWSRSRVLS